MSIYAKIEELRKSGETISVCTIVCTHGSTPLKSGAKMIVTKKAEIFGTIGGGNLELEVIKNAIKLIDLGETRLFEHNLLQQHGMCCGGKVEILVETVFPPNKLYIFGSGHVGRSLSLFANSVGLEVFVIDPRIEELNKLAPVITNRISVPFDLILSTLPFNNSTYIAVMTYDHMLDREIVAYCMKKPHAYLGMIGSRRKVEVTKKMFASLGMFKQDEIDQIDMPMGFDVKGVNPEEIAIGILAKIIEIKNKKQPLISSSALLNVIEDELRGVSNLEDHDK